MFVQLIAIFLFVNLQCATPQQYNEELMDGRLAVDNSLSCPSLCSCIPPPGLAYWLTICDAEDWGYAGIRPAPQYFCYGYDGINSTKVWIRFAYSNMSTEDNAACADPDLRAQIMTVAQRSWQTPQALADGLLIAINRPNWLFVAIFNWDLECAASHTPKDNNCCVVSATTANNITVLIGSYKVMVS